MSAERLGATLISLTSQAEQLAGHFRTLFASKQPPDLRHPAAAEEPDQRALNQQVRSS